MARKKSSTGCAVLVVLVIAIAAIIEYRTIAIIIFCMFALFWIITKVSKSSKSKLPQASTNGAFRISVSVSSGHYFPDFKPTSQDGDDFWVPETATAKVFGQELGGMIYFGKGLAAASGSGPEPALIDPGLPVVSSDYTIRQLSYWPYYYGASSEARGAYLRWLSTGRKDPAADLGYVFLYFYGLERRALHDIKTSLRAREEISAIKLEIERLLKIYTKSGSFQSYAGSLLDLLNSQLVGDSIYKRLPPPLRMDRFLTLEHKIALGQCAKEKAPLPANWAFIWLLSDPLTRFHVPVSRCPEEFKKLFFQKYLDAFGDGIVLPQSETRINIEHRPASPSLSFGHGQNVSIIDLPDVSSLRAPISKLQEIAKDCELKLNSYSRLIGKDINLVGTFEAIIELPLSLWSDEHQRVIKNLYDLVSNNKKPLVRQFKILFTLFPLSQDLSRQKMQSLCRALAEGGLGIEPDVRFGGDVPEQDSNIAIFIDDEKTQKYDASAQYLTIALILQLGAGVAASDGDISDTEKGFLLKQLETWLVLNESERRRLQAKLQLWQIEPPKISRLKKKIEALDILSRESVGNFLAVIALADEKVPPEEIKILEKVFIMLGLDPNTIYAKLHIGATSPVTVRAPAKGAGGYPIPRTIGTVSAPSFKLDSIKLKALQEDSERVAKVLGAIFSQVPSEQES